MFSARLAPPFCIYPTSTDPRCMSVRSRMRSPLNHQLIFRQQGRTARGIEVSNSKKVIHHSRGVRGPWRSQTIGVPRPQRHFFSFEVYRPAPGALSIRLPAQTLRRSNPSPTSLSFRARG